MEEEEEEKKGKGGDGRVEVDLRLQTQTQEALWPKKAKIIFGGDGTTPTSACHSLGTAHCSPFEAVAKQSKQCPSGSVCTVN